MISRCITKLFVRTREIENVLHKNFELLPSRCFKRQDSRDAGLSGSRIIRPETALNQKT